MLSLLLPLNFLLVYANLHQVLETRSRRELFLTIGVTWAAQLVFFTEILSWFYALFPVQIVLLWSFSSFFLFLSARKNIPPLCKDILQTFFRSVKSVTIPEKLKIAFVFTLCFALFVIALVSPPNNWDSMTYHMARVMYWMQNGTLRHYPSSIIRQHYQAPFAESVILHLQTLSGSDRYANLVQWFSYAGTLAGVSLIAKELGGDKTKQITSVVLAATIPMAILQATSTQNDLVVSFWIISSVYFLMTFFKERNMLPNAVFIGLSIGLALLCKSTAYVWLLPFCVAFGLCALLRKHLHTRLLQTSGIIFACVFILNIGHFYRNHDVYRHPLGGTVGERQTYVNAIHTPSALVSNIIRNFNIHLKTPFYYWNRACRLTTLKIHDWLGMSLHDSRTTFYSSGNVSFHDNWLSYSEDMQGNMFHFLLIGFATALLAFNRKSIFFQQHLVYFCLCLVAFLVFCYMLRWQEWHSRLHLPLFILLMPLCAVVLNTKTASSLVFFTPMAAISVLCLLTNDSKSILPIHQNIFQQNRMELYTKKNVTYQKMSAYIASKQYSDVGLQIGLDDGDYLFWVFLKDNPAMIPFRIKHINVNNPSAKAPVKNDFTPDCLISTTDSTAILVADGHVYRKSKCIDFCCIYQKSN